ncbi:MAG: hypothetical protein WDW36_002199 [Sanguina aurantia]
MRSSSKQAARTVAPRFVQLLPPPLMIQHVTEDADQLLLWSGEGTVQVKIAAVIMGYMRREPQPQEGEAAGPNLSRRVNNSSPHLEHLHWVLDESDLPLSPRTREIVNFSRRRAPEHSCCVTLACRCGLEVSAGGSGFELTGLHLIAPMGKGSRLWLDAQGGDACVQVLGICGQKPSSTAHRRFQGQLHGQGGQATERGTAAEEEAVGAPEGEGSDCEIAHGTPGDMPPGTPRVNKTTAGDSGTHRGRGERSQPLGGTTGDHNTLEGSIGEGSQDSEPAPQPHAGTSPQHAGSGSDHPHQQHPAGRRSPRQDGSPASQRRSSAPAGPAACMPGRAGARGGPAASQPGQGAATEGEPASGTAAGKRRQRPAVTGGNGAAGSQQQQQQQRPSSPPTSGQGPSANVWAPGGSSGLASAVMYVNAALMQIQLVSRDPGMPQAGRRARVVDLVVRLRGQPLLGELPSQERSELDEWVAVFGIHLPAGQDASLPCGVDALQQYVDSRMEALPPTLLRFLTQDSR